MVGGGDESGTDRCSTAEAALEGCPSACAHPETSLHTICKVCIEDPFELSHDLGRTVDRQTSGVLRKEFLRAATLLRDSPNPLHQLFERFIGSTMQRPDALRVALFDNPEHAWSGIK